MLFLQGIACVAKRKGNFMKKILGFALILCVIISTLAPSVLADVNVEITENDGKGTVIAGGIDDLNSAVKNCSNTANVVSGTEKTDKNWSVVSIADIEDEYFDKAIRIESKGTTAAPSTNQVRATFTTDGVITGVNAGICFMNELQTRLGGAN